MAEPWQSALVAAVTAALVTYSLEYAAKPALEVRKARILDEAQAARNVQSCLKRLAMHRAMLRKPELFDIAPEHAVATLTQLRSTIAELDDELCRVRAESIPQDVLGLLAYTTGTLDAAYYGAINMLQTGSLGALVSGTLMVATLDVEEQFTAVADYLLTPRSRPLGRWYHRRKVRKSYAQILAEVEGDPACA